MINTKQHKFFTIFYAVVLLAVLVYLLVPLSATLLYSIATSWTTSIFPEAYTVKWFAELLKDGQFYAAMGRTILLALVGTFGSIVLIVPTVYVLYVYHTHWLWMMDSLQIMAFSVPAVISAMALMSAYSGLGIPMIVLVIGSYIVGGIPMIQLGTRNALRAIDAKVLVESAEILGTSKFTAFTKIILPNIKKGVIAAALFRFSTLFGEFGTLNLLVGGDFPNIQIFLRQNMTKSGHYTAAISISYFVIVTLMTVIGLALTNSVTRKERK
ncbi:ABC transporter permease [Streptococcus merionis]|uniref:ABC transporter permease SP1688 n=1 Tax=Streptococcus merionis TaxID=400065 RepID=A0A239SPI9_9STRE|nr:ABC transporter permease subunit [Streptococcus merionis]SNU86644.1 ABC transporter permease SP1688 [Streptococcus merionis]